MLAADDDVEHPVETVPLELVRLVRTKQDTRSPDGRKGRPTEGMGQHRKKGLPGPKIGLHREVLAERVEHRAVRIHPSIFSITSGQSRCLLLGLEHHLTGRENRTIW